MVENSDLPFSEPLSSDDITQRMIAHWDKLDEPQRKDYKRLDPGTVKDIGKTQAVESQDLTKYEP